MLLSVCLVFLRRTPSGVRGLKLLLRKSVVCSVRRTPSGVRGLKFSAHLGFLYQAPSHPVRGAWIEIVKVSDITNKNLVAPRQGLSLIHI